MLTLTPRCALQIKHPHVRSRVSRHERNGEEFSRHATFVPLSGMVAGRKVSDLHSWHRCKNAVAVGSAGCRRCSAGCGGAAALAAIQYLRVSSFTRRPPGGVHLRRIRTKRALHHDIPGG